MALWRKRAGQSSTCADPPSRQHVYVHAGVLAGGTGLRQITLDGAVSWPLPRLPEHGRLITNLVARLGAAYAFGALCFRPSASVSVYRIVADAAHRLGIPADVLFSGPRHGR